MNPSLEETVWQRMERVAQALEQNNMKGYCVKTRQEVISLLKQLIPEKATVAVGGSVTLDECGVLDFLRDRSSLDRGPNSAGSLCRSGKCQALILQNSLRRHRKMRTLSQSRTHLLYLHCAAVPASTRPYQGDACTGTAGLLIFKHWKTPFSSTRRKRGFLDV